MLNFFKLSMLSACLVNTVAFASGHPNHQEVEETTFTSAPLQFDDFSGEHQPYMYQDIYSIDDASTGERDAWVGTYNCGEANHPSIYFREPEAKIVQKEWRAVNKPQPASWVGESYLAHSILKSNALIE